MTDKEVCRYLELANRRMSILLHSGTDWKPKHEAELDAIDRELAGLRALADEEHKRREGGKAYGSSKRYNHA